jgi:hypothetical protein
MLTEQMKKIYISSMSLRKNNKIIIENYLKLISDESKNNINILDKTIYEKKRIN